MKRTVILLAVGALLLGCPIARAQQVDEASKSAARDLGREGLEAYKAGRYDEAVEKLSRAYAVVKVPGLGLWTARALEKAGKLVEASEIYHEVGMLPVTEGDRAVQEVAQQEAAKEREALLPRIPKLAVQVQGAAASEVEVMVDGVAVASALIGVARPANPGSHTASAKLGEQEMSEEVTLAEGESKTVVLELSAPATAEPPAVERPATAPGTNPTADRGPHEGKLQRTLGWVGLGVGGAGLVFGTATGIMVLKKKSALEGDGCVDGACYTDQGDDVDSYNSMRTLSTVGFVVGGVGAAAGAALLLTAPKPKETGSRVRAWVGVGSAGLAGSF